MQFINFMTPIKTFSIPLLLAIALLANGCATKRIQGWWKAGDGTVFNFRGDKTFVGIDYHGTLIWGNWTKLGDDKYGFQSLYHAGYYNPQYAIMTANGMKYARSNPTVSFISAKRISAAEGKKEYSASAKSLPTESQRP
jgi:hypothetical protein